MTDKQMRYIELDKKLWAMPSICNTEEELMARSILSEMDTLELEMSAYELNIVRLYLSEDWG